MTHYKVITDNSKRQRPSENSYISHHAGEKSTHLSGGIHVPVSHSSCGDDYEVKSIWYGAELRNFLVTSEDARSHEGTVRICRGHLKGPMFNNIDEAS